MDLHQPPTSAFARFSDLLKETKKRKPSINQPNPVPILPQNDTPTTNTTLTSRRSSRDERRGSTSSASYTDKLRHMLTPTTTSTSPSPRPRKTTCISDLPTEVLQHIFLYLDFWTLLRSQRVCQRFHSLIPGSSPLLLEVLYLKPSRSLQIYSCVPATFDFDFDVTPRSVEDGAQPVGSRFSRGVQREFRLSRRSRGLVRWTGSEIVFHPVVLDLDRYLLRADFRRSRGSGGGGGGGKKGEEGEAGSWRDMLVSMPPLRELRIRHGRARAVVTVLRAGDGEDGVRLGDLFRVMDGWAGGEGYVGG